MLPHEPFAVPAPAIPAPAPAPAAPSVPWGPEPGRGFLQGPLDLGFFRDQTFCLDLGPHQVALLTGEGRLSRLFPGGRHLLVIGDGPGAVPADHQLIMLDLSETISYHLSRHDSVTAPSLPDHLLLGGMNLAVTDPEAFFATFMAGHCCLEPVFVTRLVRQAALASLPVALENALATDLPRDIGSLQETLGGLEPDILVPYMEPCGLACVSLSLYAADPETGNRPPVAETAGHWSTLGHN